MPEVHVPKLGGKGLLKPLLEIAMIGVGVFLGLAGEQWRQSREHEELADAAIARFRTELTANRAAVAGVIDYHAERAGEIRAYLAAKPDERDKTPVRLRGIRFAALEHTAWDLSMATQSLSYIDPEIAFKLSRIYDAQSMLRGLTQGMTQAMYLQPPGADREAFFQALSVYYGDTNVVEPQLIKLYDELLPQLGGAAPPHSGQ